MNFTQEFPPQSDPESVTLEHMDGRELMAHMVKGEKIAEGSMGDIYNATIVIGNKNVPLVLKEYRAPWQENLSQEKAEAAFANYALAKNAGLKVFKTFRLIKDRGSIVMTNGMAEDTLCVSINGRAPTTLELFGSEKLETIANFDELLNEAQQQVELATQKRVHFDSDSFLFLVNTKKNTIDFVIGDMDWVGKIPEGIQGDFGSRGAAYDALKHMIILNVSDPSLWIEKLNNKFDMK